MADRSLSYVLRMEDETQEAIGRLEGGLARINSGFLGIPTVAAAAAIGIVGVGVAAEQIAEKLLQAAEDAVKLGIEWQHTVSDLAAAADISIAKAQEMGAAFGALSGEVPQGALEIADAYAKVAGRLEAYTGEALSAAQATELMRAAAEGAVAGNQSLDSATAALVQMMTASHTSIEEQSHVMDVLFETSRLTGASYEQLSLIMGRLQARMGEAAPPIEDVGLAMAVMTEAGLQGARGMQVVTQMMNALSDPSERARQDLEGLGVEILKNANGSLNLRGTLEELTHAFANIDDPVRRHALAVELVGKEYAGVFESALRAANGHLDDMADKLNKANAAQEAASKHADDLKERVEKLGNQVKITAAQFGEEFAADLVNFADLFDEVGSSVEVLWRVFGNTAPLRALGAEFATFGATMDGLSIPAKIALGLIPGVGPALAIDADVAIQNLGAHQAKAIQDAAKAVETANAELDKAWEKAHQMIPPAGTTSQQEAAHPLDSDALRQDADLLISLGTEGEKLHQTMLKVSQETELGGLGAQLSELLTEEAKQEEAFRRAFDPAHPQEAADRIATLRRLTDEYTEAAKKAQQTGEQGDIAARNAAQAALDSFNQQIVGQTRLREEGEKTEAFRRQQESAAKQAAAEEKRQAEEAARAIHEMAISGFEEGTQRNELIQSWGKLGSDSIVALTEALADPAHMRSAGSALSNSIASLTDQLHEAGVADWQDLGHALTDAFRLAITDGTPENVLAAQDLLSQTVQTLGDTQAWSEWEKAGKAAGDRLNLAIQDTAEKIEDTWREHDQKMAELEERFGEKARVDSAREQVDKMTTDRKSQLDKQTLDQRQHDQDLIESMRLVDQQRDSSIQQGRQQADAATNRLRSERDAGIQTSRALADAEAEHQQRLADIAAKGGPDVAAQTAAENQSFDRQQSRFNLQQERAQEDRRRAEADAAVDLATRITREQADKSRHEADALAIKAKEHELAGQEQQTQLDNAGFLKNYKKDLEVQLGADKETLENADKARQIANIDAVAQHAEEVANRQLSKTQETANLDSERLIDEIEKKHPGFRALVETLPTQTPTNVIPTNPRNVLDQAAAAAAAAELGGHNLTIGTLAVTNNGILGVDGGMEALAGLMVESEQALLA